MPAAEILIFTISGKKIDECAIVSKFTISGKSFDPHSSSRIGIGKLQQLQLLAHQMIWVHNYMFKP